MGKRKVGGVTVRGVDVGPDTRCRHYGGPTDVIAIRFACCGEYFPCFRCHESLADHPSTRWPRERFDEGAVLCGACGSELTVRGYLDCGSECPTCGAAFNPGCREHRDRYFEV